MNEKHWFRAAFVQATLAIGGLFYALTGVALLFAPRWFFENVGTFPPFNRHYLGDTGAFTLALGLGLLLAARDPLRQRVMIVVGLVATLVHTANHAYGDLVLEELTAADVVADLVPLVIYAVLLVVAYLMAFVEQAAAYSEVTASRSR
ncbi:MAG: hypothetical protein D6737_18270 [Chloroflexi bacterium]|nr:MAG: hypothetical protein D6737_18270 [Chloroflexota bacterium]